MALYRSPEYHMLCKGRSTTYQNIPCQYLVANPPTKVVKEYTRIISVILKASGFGEEDFLNFTLCTYKAVSYTHLRAHET